MQTLHRKQDAPYGASEIKQPQKNKKLFLTKYWLSFIQHVTSWAFVCSCLPTPGLSGKNRGLPDPDTESMFRGIAEQIRDAMKPSEDLNVQDSDEDPHAKVRQIQEAFGRVFPREQDYTWDKILTIIPFLKNNFPWLRQSPVRTILDLESCGSPLYLTVDPQRENFQEDLTRLLELLGISHGTSP